MRPMITSLWKWPQICIYSIDFEHVWSFIPTAPHLRATRDWCLEKRATVLLSRRFVPECHYSLKKYNAWSLICRYQFQPKCYNCILYSAICRHSRRLQSQCAAPSATQTPPQNLMVKHGLTGQQQNLVLKNGRLLLLTVAPNCLRRSAVHCIAHQGR